MGGSRARRLPVDAPGVGGAQGDARAEERARVVAYLQGLMPDDPAWWPVLFPSCNRPKGAKPGLMAALRALGEAELGRREAEKVLDSRLRAARALGGTYEVLGRCLGLSGMSVRSRFRDGWTRA